MGFMNFFHRHKLGPITEDGRYQYCEKCGKAVEVECACRFQETARTSVFSYEGAKIPSHQKIEKTCKHCGRVVIYSDREESIYEKGIANGYPLSYYLPQ